MGQHARTDVSKEELKRAQDLWRGFTKVMTYTATATAGVLVLMAIFLL